MSWLRNVFGKKQSWWEEMEERTSQMTAYERRLQIKELERASEWRPFWNCDAAELIRLRAMEELAATTRCAYCGRPTEDEPK